MPLSVPTWAELLGSATRSAVHLEMRDTYAVEKARQGADEGQLLTLLGLADDPRNRLSVSR